MHNTALAGHDVATRSPWVNGGLKTHGEQIIAA